MTTTTQPVQRSGEKTTPELPSPDRIPLFNLHKKIDLIRAVQEENCPNFDDVREYAKLAGKIQDETANLPMTSASRRILRKQKVAENGYLEKISVAYNNMLNSQELAKYGSSVINDIAKISPALAERLVDKRDLYHHEKYLEKIKQKHSSGKIKHVSEISKLDINDVPVIPEQTSEKTNVITEEAPSAVAPEIDTVPEFVPVIPVPENETVVKPAEPVSVSPSPIEFSVTPDKQAEVLEKPEDDTIEIKLSNFFKLYTSKSDPNAKQVAEMTK